MKTTSKFVAAALAGAALASAPAFAEIDSAYSDRDANGHRIEQRIAPYTTTNPPQYDAYGRRLELNQFGQGHLAREYYLNDRYYVRNWRNYGVSAPPAGYRWVRVGDDLMLVSRASGRIAEIVALR